MNRPKAFIKIGGVPIIERQAAVLLGGGPKKGAGANGEAGAGVFDELLVIAKDPAPYEALGFKTLPDDPEFSRLSVPLVGIYTGLKAAVNGHILAVACDMPFISGKLALRLAELGLGHDAVVPVTGGYKEPLFTVYSKTALARMRDALKGGRLGLHRLFNDLDVLYVYEEELKRYDPGLLSFVNVNTPEELDIAESLARRRQERRF